MQRPFNLPIHLPRGPEHYWKEMRDLSSKGGFTINDIVGCTSGVAYNSVKGYMLFLAKGGYIEKIGERPSNRLCDANVYRVAKNSRAAPVQRRPDYTGERGVIRERLWQTMRRMQDFSIAELCFQAQAGDMEIKQHTADKYIRALINAGVVRVITPYRKGAPGRTGARAGRYALKPKANTGPKPPKIFKTKIVFDPNTQKIVGEPETSEVSL
ncbi:MAG TPA: hypothetical protein VIF61_00190 [Methylocystis sp.]|jgi:hypothetical protein